MPASDILGSASLISLLHGEVEDEMYRHLTASLFLASQNVVVTIV